MKRPSLPLVCAALLAGCGSSPQEGTGFETTNGKLSGRVLDATPGAASGGEAKECETSCASGFPSAGAEVEILGFSLDSSGDSTWKVSWMLTDSHGRWSATLAPGRYVVVARSRRSAAQGQKADTLLAASHGVVVGNGSDSVDDMILLPPIDLIGRVIPASGDPSAIQVCAAGFTCSHPGSDSVWVLRQVPRGLVEIAMLGPSGAAGIVDIAAGMGAPTQAYVPDLPLGSSHPGNQVVAGYGNAFPVVEPFAYDSSRLPAWYSGKDFSQLQVHGPPR